MNPDTIEKIVIPIFTFVLGFLAHAFVPTAKDRFDKKTVLRENATKQKKEMEEKSLAFARAMKSMLEVRDNSDIALKKKAYWDTRSTGDIFFSQLDTTASYIRDGSISVEAAEQEFIEGLREHADKNIPFYFEVMKILADELGLPMTDTLSDSTCRNVRYVLKGHMSFEEFQKLMNKWGLPHLAGN